MNESHKKRIYFCFDRTAFCYALHEFNGKTDQIVSCFNRYDLEAEIHFSNNNSLKKYFILSSLEDGIMCCEVFDLKPYSFVDFLPTSTKAPRTPIVYPLSPSKSAQ